MIPRILTKARAGIAAGMALLLLVAAGAYVAYMAADHTLRALSWVDHTREVRLQMELGLLKMVDAEAAERGYLLTHNKAFLDSFEPNIDAATRSLENLMVLTKDNPIQQQELKRLMPLYKEKIDRMRQQMLLRETVGLSAAIASVSTLEGKRLMDEVRSILEAMGDRENALLSERAAVARASLQQTLAAVTIGGGLAIFLVALAIWSVRRELAIRRVARESTEAAKVYAESIVDTVRQPLVVLDEDLRVQSANRSFYKMFRHEVDDVRGKLFFELDRGAWASENLHQRLREAVSEDRSFADLELKYATAEGVRTFSLNGSKLYRPGNHQTASLLAIEDITEQRSMQQVHLHFRALFESLPGLYLVLMPELTIVAVSDAYLKAVGRTREGLLGQSLFAAFPPLPDEERTHTIRNLQASLNRVLQDGQPDTMAIQRYDLADADGTIRESYWSPVNSAVLGENGKIEYLIHRVEEVTEYVKSRASRLPIGDEDAKVEKMQAEMFLNSKELAAVNQQLRSANAELEAFSYSISHDLRAPLRHVAGFADLLRNRANAALDEKSQRYLNTILESTKRMGQLIDDLLGFSRMARSELRYGKVDLDFLVQGVVDELQATVEGRHIEWSLQPLGRITGDFAMLRQAFVNLISNAVKYTRPRDPAVIEIGRHESVPGIRGYYVRDNGVGFDPAYQDKLFGVFQRLHRAEEFEGTGIGLANVRRIITRHGGRIWAESILNHGTTFYFSLPEEPASSKM